jgi:hypothetical protein
VWSAGGRVHLVARGADGVGVGEVDLDRQALAPLRLHLRDDVGAVRKVEDGDRRALPGQPQGVGPADAVGAAGDDGDAPVVPPAHAVTVSGRSACSAPIRSNSGAKSMWTRREVTLPSALRSSRETQGTLTLAPPLVV